MSDENRIRRQSASGSIVSFGVGHYPLPAQLAFCPGGVTYGIHEPIEIAPANMSTLIQRAKENDDRLRQYILLYDSNSLNHFLPSLSVLAEAAFGRFTGCKTDDAKTWADKMVLSHFNNFVKESIPSNEEEVIHSKPASAPKIPDTTVPILLKKLLKETEAQDNAQSNTQNRPRPCGYVFKRGDIAWNCRTCQSDPTCVICDECFRESNHDGHEVYFHRTTPGGCCDCGDIEAWNLDGCCDKHRPVDVELKPDPNLRLDDPMEAVKMAAQARQWASETLSSDPATRLPPRFLAALATVIGAAVHCVLDAVDGSGAAADGVQWTKRWADEAARVANFSPHNEDYIYASAPPASLQTFLTLNRNFPENLRLHLRLHNDDVHTFDEVIDALHESTHARRTSNNDEQHPSLVSLRENATQLTHHVDSDGQVTVKTYANISSAMRGFKRLKSRGLHCAVVTTAQVDLESRARALCTWLAEISAAHPAAQALLIQALVQLSGRTTGPEDSSLSNIFVWHPARMMPPWAAILPAAPGQKYDEVAACRRRFDAFPPHLPSSYLTREEAELLHGMALASLIGPTNPSYNQFLLATGTTPEFYARVPYRLASYRYHKSPHALWGTLPSEYSDTVPGELKHPLLERFLLGQVSPTTKNSLLESVYVVDTDLRKQQEGERITVSVYPHKLPGLNIISGIGMTRIDELDARRPPLPSPMDLRHLLATSSFRAPISPVLLLLLLDPYPTKQLRGSIHSLFLSLLTNGRFKSRFAGALAVAYRPLSTLFCAGVGTEADTPLHFTVQIFTAGSLVRALGHGPATERLLLSDDIDYSLQGDLLLSSSTLQTPSSIGIFVPPIAHIIARCIHTNLLGATKEVNMILLNTAAGNDENSQDENTQQGNVALLPALTYVAGEHPLMTPLPAAPDDGFLDSRSTKHKRLPHLLRDLDYVIETPGTSMRLLLPARFPVYQGPTLSFRGEDVLAFPAVFARLLRLAQGMDPQKRKISGGHVEYEQNRWLEAFGLSLNFGGTRDALAESPCGTLVGVETDPVAHITSVREAIGNTITALLRELKLWLYREGMLETGLPVPPGGGNGTDLAQVEALQRSTLHVSSSQYAIDNSLSETTNSELIHSGSSSVALSCATGVKMTEAQLTLIENALKLEATQQLEQYHSYISGQGRRQISLSGPVMGDWLRVPHSPLAGDTLSFHLPLHRALAKCVKSICSAVVPQAVQQANPNDWWKLPVLDDQNISTADPTGFLCHPLVPLLRPTLRSSNCRIVWASGPECTSQEAQRRRLRSRTVSANIAVAKVIHSMADHPIRCLAAAQQIERHLWVKNGNSVAGMAMNYSSAPLCRSFRDLDLLLVQLSAAGLSCGLGARRVLSLLLSRFSMDGYLCDPEKRASSAAAGSSPFNTSSNIWVNPPRLQDPDHAVILAESFFSTVCVLVTELPPPPPKSSEDDSGLRRNIRRELLHALAAEPRSHSEAMTAASCGISRREESEGAAGKGGTGGLFRDAFTGVLNDIGRQKNQNSSRAASGPATFELKAEFCDEYDPTFFHLRRQEHQHAMDVVARLRKQKWGDNKDAHETHCLPLVCAPPKAHPRFLPCRLLLHLDSMDAALRRALLFALTNGSWLPPPEPFQYQHQPDHDSESAGVSDMVGVSSTVVPPVNLADPLATFPRRLYHTKAVSASFPKRGGTNDPVPFSSEIVAASSVSFLEVLQLLTLQVHTLEECASLHRNCPDLDSESRALSAGLSINSYLSRLVRVPDSLIDVWALKPFPEGPLKSNGTGERKGSILGLLIALYEHRSDHGAILDNDSGDFTQADDGHGGARSLASSGLKWLLRFVHALVEGAPSVSSAVKSATTGVPVRSVSVSQNAGESVLGAWTIDEDVQTGISGMLKDLPDLWPKPRVRSASPEKASTKSKEARKAAQQRVLEKMKQKQAAFAATISPSDVPAEGNTSSDEETDLCIICRCDDADGENNGPIGYLGHVQRSRMVQMRAARETSDKYEGKPSLVNTYRVVGHMGCQLRETEAMDSPPITCLAKGSVVSVLKSKVSQQYGILSRRVLVRHVSKDPNSKVETTTEGWASIQSSQGYVILSPLVSLCYSNSRWGCTRPIVKQCGHAAHFKCVETHTLSLHQRAAGEQPYDGRFAANIADGEFLCPLCKQLSNVLIPRNVPSTRCHSGPMEVDGLSKASYTGDLTASIRHKLTITRSGLNDLDVLTRRALEDFGSHLYNAMSVPWDRVTAANKKRQERWHPAIHKWDFEEPESERTVTGPRGAKNILRLLRQQLIAWSAVGHSAAALEAGSRGVEEVLPFGVLSETSDPWPEYSQDSADSHPTLYELKRTLAGAVGLLEVLLRNMATDLDGTDEEKTDPFVIGFCLANIIEGRSWLDSLISGGKMEPSSNTMLWSELFALMSSLPSHVSRDGTIQQRCEARATAAAMWAVKGVPCDGQTKTDPPAPFAIMQLYTDPRHPAISSDWGTMNPFVQSTSQSLHTPFRPGVASAFLYTPLLAWDFYTFSGAILSCILSVDDRELPTGEELLHLAQSLMLGRIIQAIITPDGIDVLDEMDLDEEDCWSEEESLKEGQGLVKLAAHCRQFVSEKRLELPEKAVGDVGDTSHKALLAGIGRAILPFSRALVLMLRASTAIVRERQDRSGIPRNNTQYDQHLNSILCRSDIMAVEDGFHIYKALCCPKPSEIIKDHSGVWFSRINRWLVAVVALEIHHGSAGDSIIKRSDTGIPTGNEVSGKKGYARMSGPSSHSDNAFSDESADEMAIDAEEADADGGDLYPSRRAGDELLQGDVDDSDEELADSMDEAEMVSFDLPNFGAPPAFQGNADPDESSDRSSSIDDGANELDIKYANSSRSPILPYQPSLLGLQGIGPGRHAALFESAGSIMSDLSHLGVVHRRESPSFTLIRLPKSFVELYNIVNKVKGRDDLAAMDESDDGGSSETAICLLTGAVMRSGSVRRLLSRASRPPGACTLHARKTASGIGIFFLVQKCTVLLMHNNKSAYSPSLYVDEHGEEDPQLRRGRPLFLNEARYRALELLWRQQGIPREVAQIRSTSDRVIRDDWY